MDRQRVIVSYGDIYGFARWIKRASTSPEDVQSLMNDIYIEFAKYSMNSGGTSKYMGDGIMVVLELSNGGSRCAVLKFMKESIAFAEKVKEIITENWKEIDFRLRMTAGYVYKSFMSCGNCSLFTGIDNRKKSSEFIGYPINLAQRLLSIEPRILCICHESVKKIIDQKRFGIKIKKLKIAKEHLSGIDPEDLKGLWSFHTDPKYDLMSKDNGQKKLCSEKITSQKDNRRRRKNDLARSTKE